jgi:hypothetical protein
MSNETYAGRDLRSRVVQLGVLALFAIYGSIAAGEFAVGAGLASRVFGGIGLPITLLVHTLITLPVAFVAGYALVRYAPELGRRAVTVVALVWSALIVVLQLAVYEPHVVGLSALKIAFVVAPLFMGSAIARRALARRRHA